MIYYIVSTWSIPSLHRASSDITLLTTKYWAHILSFLFLDISSVVLTLKNGKELNIDTYIIPLIDQRNIFKVYK